MAIDSSSSLLVYLHIPHDDDIWLLCAPHINLYIITHVVVSLYQWS